MTARQIAYQCRVAEEAARQAIDLLDRYGADTYAEAVGSMSVREAWEFNRAVRRYRAAMSIADELYGT